MKQTAVEWLGKELESYGDPEYCKLEWETLDSLIQQAKDMEKEQLSDAWNNGMKSDNGHFGTFEQYYNDVFKISK